MNYYFVDNCTYLNMFRKYRTRTILDNKSSNNNNVIKHWLYLYYVSKFSYNDNSIKKY